MSPELHEAMIQKLGIEHGDIVIVTLKGHPPLEHAEKIRALVEGSLHEVGKEASVIVVSDDVTFSILATSTLPNRSDG